MEDFDPRPCRPKHTQLMAVVNRCRSFLTNGRLLWMFATNRRIVRPKFFSSDYYSSRSLFYLNDNEYLLCSPDRQNSSCSLQIIENWIFCWGRPLYFVMTFVVLLNIYLYRGPLTSTHIICRFSSSISNYISFDL